MKRSLRIYLGAVISAGAVVTLAAILAAPPALTRHNTILATLLITLQTLTYLAPVKIATKRQVTFYAALQTVSILTLPPGAAAALSGIGGALGNIYARRPWFNVLFNAAQMALSVVAAGMVYRLLAPSSLAESGRDPWSALALIPAGALLYLVGAIAVDCAAAIQRRTSPWANWWTVRGPTLLPHIALVAIGAATATAVNHLPWLMLVAVAPVVAVRATMRAAMEFDAQTLKLVEEITDRLDGHDPHRGSTSRRMMEVAERVAQARGLTDEECRRVILAARLHDVAAALPPEGTIAAADAVAQGRHADRYEHARQSAAYVEKVLNLPNVAEAIRYHHERFDGRGRPAGLVGEDIPQESRIIAIVAAWDELTSLHADRPTMDEQQALEVLRAGARTKWDPAIVETLAQVMDERLAPGGQRPPNAARFLAASSR